jgi:hypothetical protein
MHVRTHISAARAPQGRRSLGSQTPSFNRRSAILLKSRFDACDKVGKGHRSIRSQRPQLQRSCLP